VEWWRVGVLLFMYSYESGKDSTKGGKRKGENGRPKCLSVGVSECQGVKVATVWDGGAAWKVSAAGPPEAGGVQPRSRSRAGGHPPSRGALRRNRFAFVKTSAVAEAMADKSAQQGRGPSTSLRVN
jgi:hypothetical protein